MVGKEMAGYMIVPLYLEVFKLLNLSPTNHDPQNVYMSGCVCCSLKKDRLQESQVGFLHAGKADCLYSGKYNTNQRWGFQDGRF